jgi:polar amino acid transport system substrate-binding protein
MEAALALGMSPITAIRRVVLPQAVRIVIPPVTNDFIALFKDTSICSMILITELTGLYYQYKYDRDLVLRLALTIGLIYLFISYPLSILAVRLERRLAGGREQA